SSDVCSSDLADLGDVAAHGPVAVLQPVDPDLVPRDGAGRVTRDLLADAALGRAAARPLRAVVHPLVEGFSGAGRRVAVSVTAHPVTRVALVAQQLDGIHDAVELSVRGVDQAGAADHGTDRVVLCVQRSRAVRAGLLVVATPLVDVPVRADHVVVGDVAVVLLGVGQVARLDGPHTVVALAVLVAVGERLGHVGALVVHLHPSRRSDVGQGVLRRTRTPRASSHELHAVIPFLALWFTIGPYRYALCTNRSAGHGPDPVSMA